MILKRGLYFGLILAVIGVVFVSIGFGNISVSAASTKTLTGRVLDAATGQPLAGVTVTSSPTPPASVVTTTNYTMTFNVGTRYTLTYTKDGYTTVTKTGKVTSSTNSLRDITMQPQPAPTVAFEQSLKIDSDIDPASINSTRESSVPVKLKWSAKSGATGYTIFAKGSSLYPVQTPNNGFGNDSGWEKIGETTLPNVLTFTDNYIGNSYTRTYQVRVTNNQSTRTNELTVQTQSDGSSGSGFGMPTGGSSTTPPATTPPPAGGGSGSTPTTGSVTGTLKTSSGPIAVSSGKVLKLYLVSDTNYFSVNIASNGSYTLNNAAPGIYFPHVFEEPSTSGASEVRYYIPTDSTTSLVEIKVGQTTTFSSSSLKLY